MCPKRSECKMDVGSTAGSTALAQTRIADAVATAVLRKSIDIQAQAALQLLQALPQPPGNNPPNLGRNIDVRA